MFRSIDSAVSSVVVSIHASALDAVIGKRPRHMYFDGECINGAWAVVMRGEDAAKAGSTATTRSAKLAFNDESGAARLFVLATMGAADAPIDAPAAEARALALATALRGWYGGENVATAERFAMVADDAPALALVALVGLVNGTQPHANGANGWRVGSYADSSAVKAKARTVANKQAALATALANPDALAEALKDNPAALAALAALVGAAAPVVAPPVDAAPVIVAPPVIDAAPAIVAPPVKRTKAAKHAAESAPALDALAALVGQAAQ